MLTDEKKKEISHSLNVFANRITREPEKRANLFKRSGGHDEQHFVGNFARITTEISIIPRVCLPRVFSRDEKPSLSPSL